MSPAGARGAASIHARGAAAGMHAAPAVQVVSFLQRKRIEIRAGLCNASLDAGKQPATGIGVPMQAALSRGSVLHSGFFASGVSSMGGPDGRAARLAGACPVRQSRSVPPTPIGVVVRGSQNELEQASMTTITSSATAADISLDPPSAVTLDLHALAAEYDTYSLDALYQEIAKLKEDMPDNSIEAAAVPIRMGLVCLAIRRLANNRQVAKTIEQSGIKYYIASDRMKLARALMKASPSTVETFLSLGESHLAQLSRCSIECLEMMALSGEYRGVRLDDLKSMVTRDFRFSFKDSAHPDFVTPLLLGDRVESLHAGRLGEVVRVYKDGSACICWDDGEPQEDGLGHERMPRELLKKVDGAKVAPAAAPAAVEVEEIEVHAVPPDPADTPPTPAARPSMAEREEYCEALFGLLFGHADDAALDELCDTMEAMLDTMASRRPRSALAQAWGDLFARFAVKGGV